MSTQKILEEYCNLRISSWKVFFLVELKMKLLYFNKECIYFEGWLALLLTYQEVDRFLKMWKDFDLRSSENLQEDLEFWENLWEIDISQITTNSELFVFETLQWIISCRSQLRIEENYKTSEEIVFWQMTKNLFKLIFQAKMRGKKTFL